MPIKTRSEEIQEMFKRTRESGRSIAKATGIPEGTVRLICNGQHTNAGSEKMEAIYAHLKEQEQANE